MAKQTVELAPGESKVVTFEAIPHEVKTYSVSVNGLVGSFVVIGPPVITKVYQAGYSWYWAKHGDNYSSIHGAAEGDMCQGEGDSEGCDHDLFIGQSSYYSIYRTALYFPTSDIPIGANIIEASLKVRVADIHTGTWKLQLVDVYKWNSIDSAVYGLLGDARRVGGEVDIDRDVDSLDYLTIILNEFGKTLINKGDGYTTGYTKFGLRSNLEIAAQKPPGAEMVRLLPCKYSLEDRPILTVSYQP